MPPHQEAHEAFMIFRKEQHCKVAKNLKIRDSAAVNAVLGKMVSEMFTGWTCVDSFITMIQLNAPQWTC